MNTISEGRLSEPELMELLGAEQWHALAERRVELRHPIVAKAILTKHENIERPIITFTRELSYGGVGLLHQNEIPSGATFQIEMILRDVRILRKARCVWCMNIEPGWYQSGWRFE